MSAEFPHCSEVGPQWERGGVRVAANGGLLVILRGGKWAMVAEAEARRSEHIAQGEYSLY
jgi:hypothetical protein